MRALLCSAIVAAALYLPAYGAEPGALALGAEDDAAPWSYADGAGYVNDLVRAAFMAAGWKVSFEVLPYARCKALTLKGKLAGCFSASKTPDLAGALLYPKQPVFIARNVLFALADSPLSGCDASAWPSALKVGIVNGYEYTAAFEQAAKQGKLQLLTETAESSNLRLLALKSLDAALVTVDEVKRIEYVAAKGKVGSALKVVCDFGGEPAYVAFSPKHPQGRAAAAAFGQGYELLEKQGDIAKLQAQWRAWLMKSTVSAPE